MVQSETDAEQMPGRGMQVQTDVDQVFTRRWPEARIQPQPGVPGHRPMGSHDGSPQTGPLGEENSTPAVSPPFVKTGESLQKMATKQETKTPCKDLKHYVTFECSSSKVETCIYV